MALHRCHMLACLLLVASPALAQGQASIGSPVVENGAAAPFLGNWSVGTPTDSQADRLIDCSDPVIIEPLGAQRMSLRRDSDIEAPVVVDLNAAKGQTHWMPVDGLPSIVQWLDEDSFSRYEVDSAGSIYWDAPFLHTRCPG